MKKTFISKLFLKVVLLAVLFLNSGWSIDNSLRTEHHCAISQDDDFVLILETIGSKRILKVSFNGNEGNEGELKIYNNSNEKVLESNFELIKTPFYASVDVTNLPVGSYIAKLSTNKAVHQNNLIIN